MSEPYLYLEDLVKAKKVASNRGFSQMPKTKRNQPDYKTGKAPTNQPKNPTGPRVSARAPSVAETPKAPETPKLDNTASETGNVEKVPCPFGGGAECVKHGGNGGVTHDPNGDSMRAHQQDKGADASTPATEDPEAVDQEPKDTSPEAISTNVPEEGQEKPPRAVSSGDTKSDPVSSSPAKMAGDVDAPMNAAEMERDKQKKNTRKDKADKHRLVQDQKKAVYDWQKKNPNATKNQLVEGKPYKTHISDADKAYRRGDLKEAVQSLAHAEQAWEVVKDHPDLNRTKEHSQKTRDMFRSVSNSIKKEAKAQGITLPQEEKAVETATASKEEAQVKKTEAQTKKIEADIKKIETDTKQVASGGKPSSDKKAAPKKAAPKKAEGDAKRAEVAADNVQRKEEDAAAAAAEPPSDEPPGEEPESPKEAKAGKTEKQKKTNFSGAFDRGRLAGTRFGEAAATAEAGGYILSGGVEYGVGGMVKVGQHLLHNKKNSDKAPSRKPTSKPHTPRGSGVKQSAMDKSLPLYLDLFKAVQGTNAGNTVPSEKKARASHEASYAKRPVGVANEGIVTEDDPDQGKKWTHSEEDSVSESVDEKLKFKKKKEEEEETEKAFDPLTFLRSMNEGIREELTKSLPNSLEATFMVEELGYDVSSITGGKAYISGKNRSRFSQWAHGRLSKSISSFSELVK